LHAGWKLRQDPFDSVITAVNLPLVEAIERRSNTLEISMAWKQAWCMGSKLPLMLCPILFGSGPNLIVV